MYNSGIYAIRNKVTGSQYIGSSVHMSIRWGVHRRELQRNRHYNHHLQRAWNKYGEASFEFVVLDYVEDRKEIFATEQQWIDTAKPEYNVALIVGSGFNLGLKRSPEARSKTSAALLGRKLSPGHIKSLSLSHLGKPSGRKGTSTSESARLKISAANKGKHVGRKHTEQSRTNMSTGQRRYAEEHRRTHCTKGHPYTIENTYHVRGEQVCKECRRVRKQRFRENHLKPKS